MINDEVTSTDAAISRFVRGPGPPVELLGQDYNETCYWLREDEYSLVTGRVFFDDGFPLETTLNKGNS